MTLGALFGPAYLAGFFAAVTIAVGALALSMVTRLAGATWFVPVRRATEAMSTTLPMFLVLFVPVALGLHGIFPWARSTAVLDAEARASIDHARTWWSPAFFVARSYIYLIVWSALALAWRRASGAVTAEQGRDDSERQRILSAAGLPVLILTVSFAAFDWMMSLDPGWVSDAFGLAVATGAFAGGVGLAAVFSYAALRGGRLAHGSIRPDHFHALGRVLLTATMLWAYVGFCQFLIIWMADAPREIAFYGDRASGSPLVLSVVLVLGHFVAPFLLLLSRPLKRAPGAVAFVGGWIVCAHVLDVAWMTLPAGGRPMSLVEVVPVVVIVALFVLAAALVYRSRGAVPLHDPNGGASLRYEAT